MTPTEIIKTELANHVAPEILDNLAKVAEKVYVNTGENVANDIVTGYTVFELLN